MIDNEASLNRGAADLERAVVWRRRRNEGIARVRLNSSSMPEPNRPLELYGFPTDLSPPSETQTCPFIGARCVKQRKSDSMLTIGTCIVGLDGKPQLICPVRMRATDQIFRDVAHLLKGDVAAVMVVPEIIIREFGNVDFTVVGLDDQGHVVDFIRVEFQTNDTTGSGPLFEARQDFFAGQLRDRYRYGLNWKMTAKLVLKQTLDKAAVFSKWGKKYVWAMQDTLLARMRAYSDMSDFHTEKDDDEVLFYAYEVFRGEGALRVATCRTDRFRPRRGGEANAPRTEIAEHVLETFEELLEREALTARRSFRLTP